MTSLEKLCAIEEIKVLKARYFRYMDTKQWDEYEAIFTHDALCDISVAAVVPEIGSTKSPWDSPKRRPEAVLHGAREYREYVSKVLNHCRSSHQGHMPEISFESNDSASGVWATEDVLEFPNAAPGGLLFVHGHGHYHEKYRRVHGVWKISELRITRLREVRHYRSQ